MPRWAILTRFWTGCRGRRTARAVKSIVVSDRNWAVLVQQLLALTMQFSSISPGDCWVQLSMIPDFSGIKRAEFDRLVKHMIKTKYLYLTGGLLAIGSETEKAFGRKNFMDLYAVFSLPQQYEVYTLNNRSVGR